MSTQTQTRSETGERITKYLSRAGACSRREAERLIAAGLVCVNGKTIEAPGLKVSPADRIKVEGKHIDPPAQTALWIFHKPVGCVVTRSDEQGRTTLFDLLPESQRGLIAIGRLDIASEGLLLLTNDGGLARVLELPRTGLERTYRVRVFGKLSPKDRKQLASGITVDGEAFGSIRVSEPDMKRQAHQQVEPSEDNLEDKKSAGANRWLVVRLNEGRNREVRRALESVGLQVSRLIRTGYGPFELGNLQPGKIVSVPDWHSALSENSVIYP